MSTEDACPYCKEPLGDRQWVAEQGVPVHVDCVEADAAAFVGEVLTEARLANPASTEDRSKLPRGVCALPSGGYVFDERGESQLNDVEPEQWWAFVDRIRATERAMLHDIVRDSGHDEAAKIIASIDDATRKEWTRSEYEVRAEERERAAAAIEAHPEAQIGGSWSCSQIAAWLRSGAPKL